MEMFFKIHRGLPRQAPGSDASSLRALAMIDALPHGPRILDVGCGPGRSSIVLARATAGNVVAVDLLASFLDELRERAHDAGLSDRIEPLECDMNKLDFPDGSFDLIWSEGAIYNMGFAKGLAAWRPLLAPRAFMAVTELSWLREDPPQSVRNYWQTHYPPMQSAAENRSDIRAAEFDLVGDFSLPECDWWEEYYDPIEARIEAAWKDSEGGGRTALEEMRREAEILRQSEGSFGYVFYVMQGRS